MKAKFILNGVSYGKNMEFYGMVNVFRHINSSIILGDNIRMRSSCDSNWIGVNRKCMISTQASNARIVIGDFCSFTGSVIGCFDSIIIGNNVRFGANTLITDSDWHNDDPRVGKPMPITIEDNVWIGEGVKILKGVHIGKNSIIGAGSVVTRDVGENVIAAGNPCVVIKSL